MQRSLKNRKFVVNVSSSRASVIKVKHFSQQTHLLHRSQIPNLFNQKKASAVPREKSVLSASSLSLFRSLSFLISLSLSFCLSHFLPFIFSLSLFISLLLSHPLSLHFYISLYPSPFLSLTLSPTLLFSLQPSISLSLIFSHSLSLSFFFSYSLSRSILLCYSNLNLVFLFSLANFFRFCQRRNA